MIKIYWHGILLREFSITERAKAQNAWEFFSAFLLKLNYIEEAI